MIKELDIIKLKKDIVQSYKDMNIRILKKGDKGTVIEDYGGAYEVEFIKKGKTVAVITLTDEEIE